MKHLPLSRRKFLRVSSGAIAAGVAAPLALRSRTAEGLPSSDNPVVVGAGTKQGDEGVVYHRDIHRSDMMRGFPPPTDRRVTSHNWSNTTDALRWTNLNGNLVFKTIPIEKGDGPVWVLPRRMLDPEKLDRAQVLWGKTKDDAKRISVADWLRRSDTDALLVVHDGHIVAEQYFGDMTPYTPHRLWSASKSVLASIFASLLFNGSVEEGGLAEKYVPELAQSGLAGATIRQILDMYTGVAVTCFPSPEEIGAADEAALKEWTLGTPEFRRAENGFARMCRAMGCFPSLPHEEVSGCYDFLMTTKCDREHGKYFYYTDPNPMALQWILERTTNTSYLDHLSKLLRDLGAETRGTITLDNIGSAVSSIGLSLTARDFARWGLMLCNGGRVGSGKVIAGIKAFVDDIRSNPGPDRWTERTNAVAWSPTNTGYRSLMWTTPKERGGQPIPYAHGAFHQKCYVDVARNCVFVKLSSFLGTEPSRPVEDEPYQNDDIAVQSFLENVLPELVR